MNPYVRLAKDYKPMIRIDDIDSFEEVERIENPCNLCLKPKCSIICSKCKTTKYCSKDCQIIDRPNYDHNLVCGIE